MAERNAVGREVRGNLGKSPQCTADKGKEATTGACPEREKFDGTPYIGAVKDTTGAHRSYAKNCVYGLNNWYGGNLGIRRMSTRIVRCLTRLLTGICLALFCSDEKSRTY